MSKLSVIAECLEFFHNVSTRDTISSYKPSKMSIEKVNVPHKLNLFSDHWSPKIVGALNGQHVKLAKLKGEFSWHKHEQEDELFYVLKGSFIMEFRDRRVELNENEFLIVPRGIEHRPVAVEEVSIMLFEPASTLNTGDQENEYTKHELDWI
jgi:mannose-6-phosphate isomerase-like protein (cupin superfamily)